MSKATASVAGLTALLAQLLPTPRGPLSSIPHISLALEPAGGAALKEAHILEFAASQAAF